MTKLIKDINWSNDRRTTSWRWNDEHVKRTFEHPLRKVLLLKDGVSIVIIASPKETGVANCAIYSGDGSLKLTVHMPAEKQNEYSFYDIYYVDDRLNLVLWSLGGDYNLQCLLNPETGEIVDCQKEK